MKIMIAYDNSRNARKALDATLEMFGPLKPLIRKDLARVFRHSQLIQLF